MDAVMELGLLIVYALITSIVALYGLMLRSDNSDPSGYHDEPIPGSQFGMRRVKNSPREARFGARVILLCWTWPVAFVVWLVWIGLSGLWTVIKDATTKLEDDNE